MEQAATPPDNRQFAIGLARAFGGAIVFGLPLLMTMEMWWLGFSMPAGKLLLLVVLFLPFLVVLSRHAGFERTVSWRDDAIDALVAYAVGWTSSLVVLWLLGLLAPDMSAREIVGKVALQAVPGSIGALLAQSQLGERKAGDSSGSASGSYASELFIMAAGALFLAFNIAPTQEVEAISAQLSPARALLLVGCAVLVMHAFVYTAAFRGRPEEFGRAPWWSLALRFTVPGYMIAFGLSAFLLWSFGRLGTTATQPALQLVTVLSVPAAVGAAAARLIL